jgi:hypothetical protein
LKAERDRLQTVINNVRTLCASHGFNLGTERNPSIVVHVAPVLALLPTQDQEDR